MEHVNLEPHYSTNEIAGKCVRCLAEQELSNCIIEMLGERTDDDDLQRKYNILATFLKSPDAQELINETEQYLSDGIKVNVQLFFENDNLKYEIKTQK
jgi:hypothetical protein